MSGSILLDRRYVLLGGGALAMLAGSAAGAATVARPDLTRVVAIGGAITEIVYALGMQVHLAAIDSTSQYPPVALTQKPNLGYMRALSAEAVLATRPTLILAIEGSGPPAALATLRGSGVPILMIDDTLSPAAVTGRVTRLAALFGVPARGTTLNTGIAAGFRRLDAWRAAHPARKRVLFVLSLQNGRPMVAGTDTAADRIIALAGGVNVAAGLQGYKAVSDETVAAMAPDAVLAMSHAGPGIDAAALDAPGFRLTPAGRRHALVTMDGSYLLGLGPRTPEAALDLARRLAAT